MRGYLISIMSLVVVGIYALSVVITDNPMYMKIPAMIVVLMLIAVAVLMGIQIGYVSERRKW